MENKCSNCAKDKQINVQCGIDEIVKEPVPYIVYESAMARNEERHKADMERSDKQNRRLFIAIIIAISMFFVSNIGWLVYESQFETITYEQDGDGINNVNYGEQGDLNNGAESKDQAQEEK